MIESKVITELIGDKFGNYVIQKALQMSDGINFLAIIHVKNNLIIIKIGIKICYENTQTNFFWKESL
jgi:hypothetical protein